MKIDQGSNLVRAKVVNQSAIRRLIYLYEPITRTEISKRLNLTLPTITNNVNLMLANGTIREQEEKINAIEGSAGRKSALLEIARDSQYFIGMEILRKERTAAIVDYKGKSLFHIRQEKYYSDYESILKSTVEILETLLESNFVPREKIAGIGLCMPGIINSEKGIIKENKQWGWKNYPLVKDLRELLHYDGLMTLENDAASRAIKYSMQNKRNTKECGLYAYVLYRDGISCPIMVNGENLIAKKMGPGELSYMIMESSLPIESSMHSGRLAQLGGQRAILEQIAKEDVPEVQEIIASGRMIDAFDVIELQKAGNQKVQAHVEQGIRYLSYAINNVENLLKPDYFVVEGYLFDYEENQKKLEEFCSLPQLRPGIEVPTLLFQKTNHTTPAEAAAFVVIQQELGIYQD